MITGFIFVRTSNGFAPAIALPKTSNDKIAGKIGKVLGKLRDLDVLQFTLETEYQPILPPSEQKSCRHRFS